MQIYDTHAHLDHIENLDAALSNAREAGVQGIVCVSVDVASSQKNLEIKCSTDAPKIYLAMGMHPSDAKRENIEASLALIREHKDELIAVGEIGLDFWYKWVRKDKEKKDEQREVYVKHLEIAKELNLPAIIHTRGTWREAFETTKEVGINKAEFHWYSGPVDVLNDILDAGYLVSTSPSVAYSPESQEAMSHAPIEQMMIETDSPVFYRNRDSNEEGFQSEPKDVLRTLKAVCALKNIEEEKALEILNNNAREFFGLE